MRRESQLTDEEKAAKVKVMTETEAKIKRWFSYRRAPGGGASNPFSKFLRQLQSDERQPKRLPDWQVYMQDEEKNDAVNARFAVDYPELVGARNTINERGQLARKLLAEEAEDVREMFHKRAEEEFEDAMDSFKSRGEGGFEDPELNEEERQDARPTRSDGPAPPRRASRAHGVPSDVAGWDRGGWSL
ncbi:hypothetical protein C8R47DRAFT_1229170 [Mycena vitilis]|nr:hypothetical protein C8R47DRAFT_1229170 [Mycena vitilis]